MSKHVIPVELIVEAPTWARAREHVAELLAQAQINQQIFHYTIKNGEPEE